MTTSSWGRVLCLVILAGLTLASFGQSHTGELRLRVVDVSGRAVRTTVNVASQSNEYRAVLQTDGEGEVEAQRLPYGEYRVEVGAPGFARASVGIAIRSSIPVVRSIELKLSAVPDVIDVNASGSMVDAERAGSVSEIGADTLHHRLGSVPGRSLQDLVNSQPGWLYEGNAVLHPRGSEYQTQVVMDGIPLTDNRSPSFGPEVEADDVQSISIYTAGIPAEYGRKMGGVIEVNTVKDAQPGLHGDVVLSGGSFDTGAAFASGQSTWGKNTVQGSASGSMTDHYLNPVVPQNYSNRGTLGDFSIHSARELTPNDRLMLGVRHELSRYEIPNEELQQANGQRQTADNIETMGTASYQHSFSSNVLAALRGMVRDTANDFTSNPESTPIEVLQHNRFREGYFKADLTASRGRNELKFGVESDNTFLHEDLTYHITDSTRYDDETPVDFAFAGKRPNLEQAVYAEDLVRLGKWTVSAGFRWDHYQLLVNQEALSPRLSLARYFPTHELMLHFSYDRVFQTPSSENILLSSSTEIEALAPDAFLRLPVRPSQGDYYEAGMSKAFFGKMKLDMNYFRRFVTNYADDDQIENTTISFPISFRKAMIYGAEGKVEVAEWHHFSGFASYSYTVGNAWNPVTGGLFLGDEATAAAARVSGHFPDSQDQRNTMRGRVRYQVHPRLWVASGVQYDSGLPFKFDGDPDTVLAQYGQQVLDRINFDRGRILPSLQWNASAGVEVYKSDRMTMQLQADGQNLNNVLDVIDFGGLFSGNAIGPPRSVMLRLRASF